MAERAEKLLKKGSLVFIEGKIKNRSYDDKDGNKRYVTEVVVDSFKPLDKRENSDQSSPENYGENSYQSGQSASSSDIEGDLPF
jgi:single-strand DNA-binding protein